MNKNIDEQELNKLKMNNRINKRNIARNKKNDFQIICYNICDRLNKKIWCILG